jgi:hypothetical protein
MWGFTSQAVGMTTRIEGGAAGAPAMNDRDELAALALPPVGPDRRNVSLFARDVLPIAASDPSRPGNPTRSARP